MTEASATPAPPATPEAATARLTELSADSTWAGRVVAQDPVAFADFQKLTTLVAKNPTTETLAGALADFNGKALVDQFLAAPPAGFPELTSAAGKDLVEMLNGKPLSQETHDAVAAKFDAMLKDKDWVTRFENREQRAMREWHLATNLLAAEVAS